MKNTTTKLLWLMLFAMPLFTIISCGDDDPDEMEMAREIVIAPGSTAADDAQEAFIEVDRDYTIIFEEGVFDFTNTLSLDGKNNVVIRGAGKDKTFLDFDAQTSGGEGVLIANCDSIRFENITIRDAAGDALKARDCNKISFVNVGTVWSGEPSSDNGAYGLYPVLCNEVYIDNCYAYGASDAGIYVGQSNKVILKNCVAEGNVAGIEIENTTDADVFDNEAFDNTGGILVFDLPGLTQNGNATRVFNNNSHDNNRTNFAPPGNIVGVVPAGTGFMVLSTKNVEVFDNIFSENNFASVLIANYLLVNSNPNDPTFDPFPSGISIHDNAYTMTGDVNPNQPELILGIMQVLGIYGLAQPNILMDGLLMSPEAVCINEGVNTSFVNVNASDQTWQSVTEVIDVHACNIDPLPGVDFDEF